MKISLKVPAHANLRALLGGALLFCLFSYSNLPQNIVSSCNKGKERGEAEYQDPQELLAHSNNAAHPGGQGLHRDLEGGDGLEDLSVQDNLHTGLVTGRLETNVLHLVPAVTVTFSLHLMADYEGGSEELSESIINIFL